MSLFDFACNLVQSHARSLGVAPANDDRPRKRFSALIEEARACETTEELLEWLRLNTEAAIEAEHYERSRW